MNLLRRTGGAIILLLTLLVIAPLHLQSHALATQVTCFAYVATFGSDTVSVISVASNSVVSTIAVGDGPEGVAITPDGTKAYVTNSLDDTVTVINTATNTTTSAVNVGLQPYALAITPDGTRVYVTNDLSDTVSVIDATTSPPVVTATINVGGRPGGIAINCVTNPTPAPAPIVSLHHATLDPNGGTCVTNGIATTTSVRTPFLGYSYIPGAEECTRPGFTFQGWATTKSPNTPISLPLLRGWFDGIWRYFIANSYDLTAVWKPTG